MRNLQCTSRGLPPRLLIWYFAACTAYISDFQLGGQPLWISSPRVYSARIAALTGRVPEVLRHTLIMFRWIWAILRYLSPDMCDNDTPGYGIFPWTGDPQELSESQLEIRYKLCKLRSSEILGTTPACTVHVSHPGPSRPVIILLKYLQFQLVADY